MATILVVDDRPTNRQFLLTLLGYSRHRLVDAADGAQALDVARAQRPDLIITDILMPTMDGYEFVLKLRQDPAFARTPVIFYSATYSTPEAELLAKSAGATSVVRKPSEPGEILAAVNQALGATTAGEVPVPRAGPSPARTASQKLSGQFGLSEQLNARLVALVEIAMDALAERDPARMVENFFSTACKIAGSTCAAVGVLAEAGPALKHSFTRGADAELLGPEVQRATSARLLRENRFGRWQDDAGGYSLIGGPIASSGEIHGWIYFAKRPGEEPFSEADERIGAALAAMLALSYEHVMLYDTVQRHAARLQIEVVERKRAEAEIRLLNESLDRRVRERTAELEAVNRELEAFSYSVSHDLRAPVRHIDAFARMVLEDSEALGEASIRHLKVITDAARHMGELTDGLLALSKASRAELRRQRVDMAALVEAARRQLGPEAARPELRWQIGALPAVSGDPVLLEAVWINLLSNAVKYSARRAQPMVEIGAREGKAGESVFFVRDNGVGFDMKHADQLFKVFKRLHSDREFRGTGIGLATVRRIVERHGGRVWAEGTPGQGATFYLSLKPRGDDGQDPDR